MTTEARSARAGLRAIPGLVLSLAAVVAAACATGSSSATSPAEPEKVARIGIQPIAQTDPALISSDSEVLIANQVYDYLIDIDESNRLAARLATDWSVSPDGLEYTFDLAQGVTFHDGSAFTARGGASAFARLRDPASGYPTADLYSGIPDIRCADDHPVTCI